jgi:hypothetical protein
MKKMALAYEATFRDKRGAVRDRQCAETREEAARQIFARNSTAITVQTCEAYFDQLAGRLLGNGMDIRWLSRHELEEKGK